MLPFFFLVLNLLPIVLFFVTLVGNSAPRGQLLSIALFKLHFCSNLYLPVSLVLIACADLIAVFRFVICLLLFVYRSIFLLISARGKTLAE